MATDHTFLRTANYDVDDETDGLISRSTWSLKLSGLIAGVLLVIGRSASYGNITWAPAYHQASAPLMVIINTNAPAKPLPAIPKTLPSADPAAISRQSAAVEVITFSPGKNATGSDDGEGGGNGDGNGSSQSAGDSHAGSAGSANGASTVNETTATNGSAGSGPAATVTETGNSDGSAGSGPAATVTETGNSDGS
ncbi:MAG: hypothetical protein ABI401_05315, partial [Candidatus Dormibacter sp.]